MGIMEWSRGQSWTPPRVSRSGSTGIRGTTVNWCAGFGPSPARLGRTPISPVVCEASYCRCGWCGSAGRRRRPETDAANQALDPRTADRASVLRRLREQELTRPHSGNSKNVIDHLVRRRALGRGARCVRRHRSAPQPRTPSGRGWPTPASKMSGHHKGRSTRQPSARRNRRRRG